VQVLYLKLLGAQCAERLGENESCDQWLDELLESLDGLESSARELGPYRIETPLGRGGMAHVHLATVEHPVLARIPWLAERVNMPIETLPGHATTVRMSTPNIGVSMRMIVSPGCWDDAVLHMPGGQSGHPLSPHYADQHNAWANGIATPMKPGPTEHTLTLEPAP